MQSSGVPAVPILPYLLLLTVAACRPAAPEPESCADTLLVGGTIHALDGAGRNATAMAFRDGRILAVGDDDVLTRDHFCPDATERIDLQGRAVIPGLVDAHAHLLSMGEALQRVDLVGTRSYDEVLQRVAEQVATAAPGDWILGRGWDQNDWEIQEFPHRLRLDEITPRNPVFLGRVDGHAVLANRLALQAGGVSFTTPSPAGGEILRDDSGVPSGVLVDNAKDLVAGAIPDPTRAEKRASLELAIEHGLSLGLTGIHDAGISLEDWDLYREMADDGSLRMRVYAMLGGFLPEAGDADHPGPEIDRADGMLTVRAVKLYADGALGSRGAALIEDYSDRPGHRGLLVTTAADLEAVAREAFDRGFQVATHAIGDGGNRTIMDLYERLLAGASGDPRPRVEHAQILSSADLPRFAALGVIPSMQPTHCTSDMYWAEDRIGPDRVGGAYAWRTLLESGVEHLPLGSDFPVESANPFWGIYAAVTRQDAEGFPEGGWHPEQALSAVEALRGFTLDAAYAAFQEDDRGSLVPGKRADFLILDRDPLAVAPAALRETRVLQTWVGGRRMYLRP